MTRRPAPSIPLITLLVIWRLGIPTEAAEPVVDDMIPTAAAELAVDAMLDYAIEGAIVPGIHTRLETAHGVVHVWSPEGYKRETAAVVVYIHGYHVTVDDAWWAHGLPEQFGASGINALFIVCEAPSDPADPVRWSSTTELLRAVESGLGEPVPKGPVAAIGHSGAFRTLAQWLGDPRLGTVVLLDAGYGFKAPYLDWIRSAAHRRLITVASDTLAWTTALHRFLPSTHTVDGFAPWEPTELAMLQAQRILHIRTDLDHWQVVTVALPATLRLLRAPPL